MKKKLLKLVSIALVFPLIGCTPFWKKESASNEPQPTPAEDVETQDIDLKYAQEVITLIDGLNSNSTKEEIDAVKSRYNDLTERQKGLVTNYDKFEVIDDAFVINQYVENINEASFTIDQIFEAQRLFEGYQLKYGNAGLANLKSGVVTKLNTLSATSINRLVVNANAISFEYKSDIAQFVLLKKYIEYLYVRLPAEYTGNLENFGVFQNKSLEINGVGGPLYSGGYMLDKQTAFTESFSEKYGMISHSDIHLTSNNSVELDLDIQGEDWSMYHSAGFFVKFDKANTENAIFVRNNYWSVETDIRCNYEVVDAESHLYFVEIDLSKVTEPFSSRTGEHSFVQLYFSNLSTTSIDVSEVIYFTDEVEYFFKDYDSINQMIDKALALSSSINKELVQLTLLCNKIDSLISENEKNRITKYDQYMSKRQELNNKSGVVFSGPFTTFYDPDWLNLTKGDSSEFGDINSISFNSNLSNNAQVFADGTVGQNWTQYSKIAMFIDVGLELSSPPAFIINNNESLLVTSTLNVFAGHIYYLEFVLNTSSAFTGNPFVKVYFDGQTTTNISVSNWVGIK